MINDLIFLLIANIENEEDQNFAAQLFTDYSKMMIRKAFYYVNNRTDAEDIVQIAFEKLMKPEIISKLRTKESCTLISYIVLTVRNTAKDFLKSSVTTHEATFFHESDNEDEEAPEELIPDLETPEKAFFDKNDKEIIHKAVNQLPEKYRLILEYKYFQEMTDKEIAAELDIKADSVRAYLTRARKKLTEILTRESD